MVILLAKLFTSRTDTVLERALDAASLRQQVVANNLANANTPGFKASHVEFESLLQEALGTGQRGTPTLAPVATRPGHLGVPASQTLPGDSDPVAAVQPVVAQETDTAARNDGNNVDVEREITTLQANSLLYSALVSQVNSRFDWLRTAIFEGRR